MPKMPSTRASETASIKRDYDNMTSKIEPGDATHALSTNNATTTSVSALSLLASTVVAKATAHDEAQAQKRKKTKKTSAAGGVLLCQGIQHQRLNKIHPDLARTNPQLLTYIISKWNIIQGNVHARTCVRVLETDEEKRQKRCIKCFYGSQHVRKTQHPILYEDYHPIPVDRFLPSHDLRECILNEWKRCHHHQQRQQQQQQCQKQQGDDNRHHVSTTKSTTMKSTPNVIIKDAKTTNKKRNISEAEQEFLKSPYVRDYVRLLILRRATDPIALNYDPQLQQQQQNDGKKTNGGGKTHNIVLQRPPQPQQQQQHPAEVAPSERRTLVICSNSIDTLCQPFWGGDGTIEEGKEDCNRNEHGDTTSLLHMQEANLVKREQMGEKTTTMTTFTKRKPKITTATTKCRIFEVRHTIKTIDQLAKVIHCKVCDSQMRLNCRKKKRTFVANSDKKEEEEEKREEHASSFPLSRVSSTAPPPATAREFTMDNSCNNISMLQRCSNQRLALLRKETTTALSATVNCTGTSASRMKKARTNLTSQLPTVSSPSCSTTTATTTTTTTGQLLSNSESSKFSSLTASSSSSSPSTNNRSNAIQKDRKAARCSGTKLHCFSTAAHTPLPPSIFQQRR